MAKRDADGFRIGRAELEYRASAVGRDDNVYELHAVHLEAPAAQARKRLDVGRIYGLLEAQFPNDARESVT
jgi:hypothetical protein